MDPRRERLIRNELLFRQVNERLREMGEGFSMVSERASFVCECSDAACTEQVELTLADYERVRSHENRFFMLPGHAVDGIEEVVERHGAWIVVRKRPDETAEAGTESG